MNTKSLLYLSCFAAATLAASVVAAAPRGSGNYFTSSGGRAGSGFVPSGAGGGSSGQWGNSNWNRGNWNGNWHHHSSSHIFISSFGFPFWGFGYPLGWGYPYGYGYYPYGYYGSGYYGGYGYGGGYYGGSGYGASYYGGPSYGGYGQGYGYGGRSSVVQLQQRLAQAGYYRGAIDGIMGPRTRSALRAYQRDHGTANYGSRDRQSLRPVTLG
jgi:hypothetical protein